MSELPGQRMAFGIRKATGQAAKDVRAQAARVDVKLPTFKEDVEATIQNFTQLTAWLKLPHHGEEATGNYKDTFVDLSGKLQLAIDGIAAFERSFVQLSQQNTSRELAVAAERVSLQLEDIRELLAKLKRFAGKVLSLLEEKPVAA
jgi:hypothetical protein